MAAHSDAVTQRSVNKCFVYLFYPVLSFLINAKHCARITYVHEVLLHIGSSCEKKSHENPKQWMYNEVKNLLKAHSNAFTFDDMPDTT